MSQQSDFQDFSRNNRQYTEFCETEVLTYII